MPHNPTRLLQGFRLSPAARYALCIGVVVLATLIRWLLSPVLGDELAYVFLYLGIVLVGWVGGLGPAVIGVVLGIPLTSVFIILPQRNLMVAGEHDIITAGLFAFIGVATGAMSEAYRRALTSSEEAYRLSIRQQAELQQIYSSAPVGLGFLDENLRYLRVNEALAIFNRVPSDGHVGRHISEVLAPEIVQKVEPLLTRVLTTREPLTNIEFEGPIGADGKPLRYVRVSFYPMEFGELKGIHAVIEDITAQKCAQTELAAVEEQLRHTVKMEAVGRLAGGVAHDFNNLLMVISSYTEMLLEQLHDHPGHTKKLNAIAGAAQRAARLTRQLLAFSRKQTLQLQVVEVDSLVSNFEQLLRKAINEDVDLLMQLESRGAKVKVDPSQLEQVLLNLAVNSRDAMPQGGRLVIHTTIRKFAEETVRSVFSIPAGDYVEMSITDSGRGMSPEVQARIFDPFFTTKERGQGSGLGLAMVYGIVKQSGGYIEVQSAVGQGTTFRIWLPTTTEVDLRSAARVSAPATASGTILVVEDEETLRQAICESLVVQGYQVLDAPHGEQALSVIASHSGTIDLLLTDAVMPGISGIDLIKRVQPSHPSMKLILMSGYANAVVEGGGAGGDITFLQKPFAQAELGQIVRKLLSKSLPV